MSLKNFTLPLLIIGVCVFLTLPASADNEWSRIVKAATSPRPQPDTIPDSIAEKEVLRRIEAKRLFNSIPAYEGRIYNVTRVALPWVFSGYKSRRPWTLPAFPSSSAKGRTWREIRAKERQHAERLAHVEDSIKAASYGIFIFPKDTVQAINPYEGIDLMYGDPVPDWLRRTIAVNKLQDNLMYDMMIANPQLIEFAYWDLPIPPSLPEEDYSFRGFINRLHLPEVDLSEAVITETKLDRYNWLHNFNVAVQLSQAYLSKNWYQGGSNYLSFLGNFLWGVDLNQVFHPNWMLQSLLTYKLAITSTPDDLYHKYSISTDQFQYNFKSGYKARYNWYYTFQLQFKTQFLHSYAANSEIRSAAFLSPGELNLGLGMTYTKENAAKTLKFTATISPISYNLKTCIDPLVDPTQFGIPAGKKVLNEIGSNVDATFFWKLLDNISYTTRFFFFTDYHQLQADWENTLNFQFNRFLSTQLFLHLRYDSASDPNIDTRWKRLMMKEILSVGLSYSFSTK